MSQVLIRFTPGFWNPRDGQPGPYHLGIREEGVLAGPRSIAVDKLGNIYILDTGNRQIQKYDNKGKFLNSISIDEGKKQTGYDFCIDKDGNIYVLDTSPEISQYMDYLDVHGSRFGLTPYEIRKYDQQGVLIFKACFPFSRDWLKETGIIPQKIFVDHKGNLYLGYQAKVCQISLSAGKSDLLEPKEIIEGVPNLNDPTISFYAAEQIGDKHSVRIKKLDLQGMGIRSFELTVMEEVGSVEFLGDDTIGNVYLAVTKHERVGGITKYLREIRKIDKSGTSIVVIDNFPTLSTFGCKRDVAIDIKGNIYHLSVEKDGAELIKWHKK